MSDLKMRLHEDRQLRDAALRLFKADLEFIRADLRERGVGARVADRIGGSARDMVDEAVDYTIDNKGTVAAIVAAIALWFARIPLLNGLSGMFSDENDESEAERDAPSRHSGTK